MRLFEPSRAMKETIMLSKPVANLLSAAAFAAALAGLGNPVAAKEAEIVAVVKISGVPVV